MSLAVAASLLGYALVLGILTDRLLPALQWTSRRPQQALHLWHAVAVAVVTALSGAALLLAHDVLEHALLLLLPAEKGDLHRAYAGAATVPRALNLVALLPAALLAALSTVYGAYAIRGRRTRQAVRRVIQTTTCARVREAYLLPSPLPQAFCVPGRQPLVIVTTPMLDLLNSREIDAVLDHEREHLDRRHALQISCAEAVTVILGRVGLLRHYAPQIRRLTELAADDAATRRHGHLRVASALLTMSTAHHADQPHLPALTGTATTERIRRLLNHRRGPSTSGPTHTVVLSAAVAMLPSILVLLPTAQLL